jgi:hypothetical protein
LLSERHNPPLVQNQKEENIFQAEIRGIYDRLVESLSLFGEEGGFYGISDFAVRPDLRDRPTVMAPPAFHAREFTITILTEKFYRSDYLEVLCRFLTDEAPNYRVQIDQDFNSIWHVAIFLTAGLAQINCTNVEEFRRIEKILAHL